VVANIIIWKRFYFRQSPPQQFRVWHEKACPQGQWWAVFFCEKTSLSRRVWNCETRAATTETLAAPEYCRSTEYLSYAWERLKYNSSGVFPVRESRHSDWVLERVVGRLRFECVNAAVEGTCIQSQQRHMPRKYKSRKCVYHIKWHSKVGELPSRKKARLLFSPGKGNSELLCSWGCGQWGGKVGFRYLVCGMCDPQNCKWKGLLQF